MQDVRDSVIRPRTEATEDSASAPQLRAALTPMSRFWEGPHAEGFCFYLLILTEGRNLRGSNVDLDRYGKTFNGWCIQVGNFGPLWALVGTNTHQISTWQGHSAHTVPDISTEPSRAGFCLKEWICSTVREDGVPHHVVSYASRWGSSGSEIHLHRQRMDWYPGVSTGTERGTTETDCPAVSGGSSASQGR